jgi:hypothetical protein
VLKFFLETLLIDFSFGSFKLPAEAPFPVVAEAQWLLELPDPNLAPRTQRMILRDKRERRMERSLLEGGKVGWPSSLHPM